MVLCGALVRKHRRVLHLSVHSFTPVFEGCTRPTDLGILYDPKRKTESEAARHLIATLRDIFPQLKIHANRPYRGISDGHTNALRREFKDTAYCGIEIEVNQRWVQNRTKDFIQTLGDALRDWAIQPFCTKFRSSSSISGTERRPLITSSRRKGNESSI